MGTIHLKDGTKISLERFAQSEFGIIGPVSKTMAWDFYKIEIKKGIHYASFNLARESWKVHLFYFRRMLATVREAEKSQESRKCF